MGSVHGRTADTHTYKRSDLLKFPLARSQRLHQVPYSFVLREMTPSRQGAEQALARFIKEQSAYYPARIGQPGARFASSRLSAHLAWGTLSIREVIHAIHQTLADDRTEERQHFGFTTV